MIKIWVQSQAFAAKFACIAENWQPKRSHMVKSANIHVFFANPHVKNYHRCEKMLVNFFMTENSVILILHAYKTYYLHFTLCRFFIWKLCTFFHARQLAPTKNTIWYPTLSPRCSPPTLNFELSTTIQQLKHIRPSLYQIKAFNLSFQNNMGSVRVWSLVLAL